MFFSFMFKKLLPYFFKFIRCMVISFFEQYLQINFWKNYFYLKLNLILNKLINFYYLLEFLKLNVLKKIK